MTNGYCPWSMVIIYDDFCLDPWSMVDPHASNKHLDLVGFRGASHALEKPLGGALAEHWRSIGDLVCLKQDLNHSHSTGFLFVGFTDTLWVTEEAFPKRWLYSRGNVFYCCPWRSLLVAIMVSALMMTNAVSLHVLHPWLIIICRGLSIGTKSCRYILKLCLYICI